MKPKRPKIFFINCIVFALILLMHVLRIVLQWPAQIAGYAIPIWFSVLAVFVLIILLFFNTKALKR